MSGLIALMNSDYSQPVNLGNPEEHTIKEFAEIVQREIGKGHRKAFPVCNDTVICDILVRVIFV